MKNKLFIAMLISALLLVGCASSPSSKYIAIFTNNSSYVIDVSPYDPEDFKAFTLKPGESHTNSTNMAFISRFDNYNDMVMNTYDSPYNKDVPYSKKRVYTSKMTYSDVNYPPFEQEVLDFEGYGNWSVSTSVDRITDVESLKLELRSTSGTSSLSIWIVDDGRDHKELDMYINWGTFLTSKSDIEVTTRVGKEEPYTMERHLSTNGRSTFLNRTSGITTVILIKQMMRSPSFIAQTTPYMKNPKTISFDTRGLYNILRDYNLFGIE